MCLFIKVQPEYVDLQRSWCEQRWHWKSQLIMNCWDNPLSSYKKRKQGGWVENVCVLGCVCKFEHAQVCPWALNCVALQLELAVFPVTQHSVPLSATPEQFMSWLSCQDITRILSSSQFEKSFPSWLGSPAQEGNKFVEGSPEKDHKDDLRAVVLLLWENAERVGVV